MVTQIVEHDFKLPVVTAMGNTYMQHSRLPLILNNTTCLRDFMNLLKFEPSTTLNMPAIPKWIRTHVSSMASVASLTRAAGAAGMAAASAAAADAMPGGSVGLVMRARLALGSSLVIGKVLFQATTSVCSSACLHFSIHKGIDYHARGDC